MSSQRPQLPGISSVGSNAVTSPNYMNHGLPQTFIVPTNAPANITNVPYSPAAVDNHTNTLESLNQNTQRENLDLQNENQGLRQLVDAYQRDQNRDNDLLPSPPGTNSSDSSNSSNSTN